MTPQAIEYQKRLAEKRRKTVLEELESVIWHMVRSGDISDDEGVNTLLEIKDMTYPEMVKTLKIFRI